MKKECRFCGGELSGGEHQDQNHRWGVCIDLWPDEIVEGLDKTKAMGDKLKLLSKNIIEKYTMNTLPDAHEQATLTYAKAADDVIDVLTDFGFLTETPFDETELKIKIMSAIQKNIEGNTTYGPATR